MTHAWPVGAASVCLGAALLMTSSRAIAAERTDVEVVGLTVDAMAEPPGNEVSYYLLSVAYGRLGNTAEQAKAIAEFQRLQGQKHEREALALAPREVTKQELDANAPPP